MLRVGFYIIAWFGLMLVALQVQHLDLGHGLCGEWGCGPPVAAILGMHLFWLVLILPPSVLAARCLHWPWRKIGLLTGVVSALGLVGFGAYDYFGINQNYYLEGYIWQRYLLSLVSLVDIPVLQILIAAVAFWFVGKECPCCNGLDDIHAIERADEVALPAGVE